VKLDYHRTLRTKDAFADAVPLHGHETIVKELRFNKIERLFGDGYVVGGPRGEISKPVKSKPGTTVPIANLEPTLNGAIKLKWERAESCSFRFCAEFDVLAQHSIGQARPIERLTLRDSGPRLLTGSAIMVIPSSIEAGFKPHIGSGFR